MKPFANGVVATTCGDTQFTRTPYRPRSIAVFLISPSTPCFELVMLGRYSPAIPALLYMMSSLPNFETAALTAFSTSDSFVTSHRTKMADDARTVATSHRQHRRDLAPPAPPRPRTASSTATSHRQLRRDLALPSLLSSLFRQARMPSLLCFSTHELRPSLLTVGSLLRNRRPGYHVGSYFVGQYYSAASTMIRIDANAKETASGMLLNIHLLADDVVANGLT
nr:putative G3BP-like protein isoform X3 [Ipomoea batatas]